MIFDRLASDDSVGGGSAGSGMKVAGAAGDEAAPQRHAVPDCWVFDVDGSLIDSLTGTTLRPGAHDLLASLSGQGRTVLLWSAGGGDYARGRAEIHGIDHLCDGYFDKSGRRADGCYRVDHLPLHGHALFVDDHPEDLDGDLDVIAVSPYLSADAHDRGLQLVARRARAD